MDIFDDMPQAEKIEDVNAERVAKAYNPRICNRKRHSTPNKGASSSEKIAYILQSMLAFFSAKSAPFFVVSVLRFYCKIRDELRKNLYSKKLKIDVLGLP